MHYGSKYGTICCERNSAYTMVNRDKLLAKANQAPNNLRFSDLCKLAEAFGWVFDRQKGSHQIYFNPDFPEALGSTMNFQPSKDGTAKRTQVEQLLDAIERLGEDK